MKWLQKSLQQENKIRWGFVFLLPLIMLFSCTVWTVIFSQFNQDYQELLEVIPVSMHSVEDADYKGEIRENRNPTIKLSILADIIRDDYKFYADANSRIANIFNKLSLPIPTATLPIGEKTEDEIQEENQLTTATPILPTQTKTLSKTSISQRTPTATLMATSTDYQASPSATNTPHSYIIPSASATKTINPTNTKIPAITPTQSPTLRPTRTQRENPFLTPSSTPSLTPTVSPTSTTINTSTSTPTPTSTSTPTATNFPTSTPVHTATNTPTGTPTPTNTLTPTSTDTQSSCIPPITDDGELPEGFVQAINPADNSTGYPISRNTIVITFNQQMPTSGGGSVEKSNSYKINVVGNVNQAISILSAVYNATAKTVTLTFDTSDSEWITSTWYEIGIRSGIHNLCGTPQSVKITTIFQTETTP